jgi:hypothetical protein
MPVFLPVDTHPPASPYVREIDSQVSYVQQIESDVNNEQFDAAFLSCFEFPQTIIPLDDAGTLLRLWEPLVLRVNGLDDTFQVDDWNITMPCDDVHLLPERLARKFMEFFGKSETGRITADEEAQWMKILDTVDYQQFAIDRAPAHYMEGVLLMKSPHLRVEWNGEEHSERLSNKVSASLSLLREGDEFSAYCKLGLDNEIRSMERVTLLVG